MMRHVCALCLILNGRSWGEEGSMHSSWLFPSRSVLPAKECFAMCECRSLGLLNYIRVWHDNSGKGASASWFLKYIIVRDLQTMQKSYFICQNWLAVEKGNGAVSSPDSMNSSGIWVFRSSEWCPWLATRRSRSSPICCRNRRITACPKVICGSRSSLVHHRIGSRACSAALAALCCC